MTHEDGFCIIQCLEVIQCSSVHTSGDLTPSLQSLGPEELHPVLDTIKTHSEYGVLSDTRLG